MRKIPALLLLIAPSIATAALIDKSSNQATDAVAVEALIRTLQGLVLSAAGAVAMAMIIYGAIVLGTAGGNEDKIGKGKKILTYAIGGLIFILLSGFLIGTFIRLLGGNVN